MSTDQLELQRVGKLLYPEVSQFADIVAVYHRGGDVIFEIAPKIAPQVWLEALKRRFFDLGFFLHLYERDGSFVIVAKDIRPQKSRVPWLNIVLAVLTVFSMVFSFSYLNGGNAIFEDTSLLLPGVWFMLALMCILAFHEFGHYFAGRYHKADVSLPYFIPAPTLFGTLGAFIKSRSPFKNRTELFDVGVAGPLAGFVPALIILIVGFATATFEPTAAPKPGDTFFEFGDSLLLMVLSKLFMPTVPEGQQLVLSPLIYAGWVGLFVTMMNLLPMGQLDGGHIIYALVGRKRHRLIANTALVAMLGLAFIWTGWLFWAALVVFIVKVKHPPTLDDEIEIDPVRRRLGWIAILIFVVTFMPLPLSVVSF
ncbi:MAG: site-2 protease family protein [candidate division Zixibacteria bacterium]|nr:site-2 protease family protein [candidate division Zixibacteria bacterium]MBU1470609.1 site-2 protease family protein [candidate division Zixibacteria bacterium]MBU2624310.1 site-2 protease family protein [candidate division Zixibacteria bacterium]